MAWTIPDPLFRRRTPEEQRAYIQGFAAATGMAIHNLANDKPLEPMLDMVALMQETADEP